MLKKPNKLLLLVAGIALLAAGFYLFTGTGDDVNYRLGEVTKGDIILSISATGTLNPVITVQVGSQVSGTIAKLFADFNDPVKEGALLAQLDPTFLQAAVNEGRANVSKATAQVQEAERNFNRTSDLFKKALVSQADMDAATTALESARADLLQSMATLERADVNLRYATIRSPISGVVISRNVDVGQTVAASLQAPTLFSIAKDLRKMQVQVTVDEADIGSVKTGQPVSFHVDAFPNDTFEGKVSQVRLGPTINQNVVTYTVIVAVENPAMKLLPGMTATVTIEVDRRDDVLRVPIQAIRFKPPVEEGDQTPEARMNEREKGKQEKHQSGSHHAQVWMLNGGKLVRSSVAVGLQDLQFVELVQTDLKEGDEVIVGMEGGQKSNSQTAQNPFQPQMPTTRRRGGM